MNTSAGRTEYAQKMAVETRVVTASKSAAGAVVKNAQQCGVVDALQQASSDHNDDVKRIFSSDMSPGDMKIAHAAAVDKYSKRSVALNAGMAEKAEPTLGTAPRKLSVSDLTPTTGPPATDEELSTCCTSEPVIGIDALRAKRKRTRDRLAGR